MSRPSPRVGVLVILTALPALLGGCLVARTVYAPVKLAGKTVIVASETAGSAVVATGRIAGAALGATGSVTSDGIHALARLSQAGLVTFVDAANGTIVRVPWQEGMTLYGGAETAKVGTARRVIDLVRAGRYVYSKLDYSDETGRIPVEAGDVIRLAVR